MEKRRAPLALYHILDAIADLRSILGERAVEEIAADRTRRYAAERCVEIISEASRRIPEDWKAEYPSVPWIEIAAIGNILRHHYEDVDLAIIVELCGRHLGDLERVTEALLDKYDPEGRPFRRR